MKMNPQAPPRTGPAALLALIVAFVVASMAGALYFQHVLLLEPCPLCVLQRVAIVAVGVFAILGVLLRTAGIQFAAAALVTACGLIGAAIAGWHSWILAFPPEALACGRPFEWFHEDFPLAVWLPKLFAGEGDCLSLEWTFFGLAIPHLSLIAFAAVLAVAALALRRAWQRLREPGAAI